MKKKAFYALAAATMFGTAALLPLSVSADVASDNTTFIQKLAAKLGLDETVVETAVSETKDEIHAARDAEKEAKIAEAVTAGTLTQRQADLINTASDAREELKDEFRPDSTSDLSTMTEDERRAERESNREAMEQKLIDALNADGLNTTADELKAAQDAAREAGIMIGRGGHGGPRGGFGM